MAAETPETPDEQLAILILPWAKEHHEDHYNATLKVAMNPPVFRRYLLRLIELRAVEDKAWRNAHCPIRVLDETSLKITARLRKTGEVRVFRGRNAKGPIDHRIWELMWDHNAFAEFENIKQTLDLTYAESA